MNAQALELIHRHHGYIDETVDLVSAFFRDTRQAHKCADELRSCVSGVLIFGTEVTFAG
jgi:hypothetical protein